MEDFFSNFVAFSEYPNFKKDFPSLKKRISQGHQTEQNKADQFFDVCNEKINTLSINDVPKAKKPKVIRDCRVEHNSN